MGSVQTDVIEDGGLSVIGSDESKSEGDSTVILLSTKSLLAIEYPNKERTQEEKLEFLAVHNS